MPVLMWRVMAIIVGSQLAASAKAEASPIKAPVGISDNHRYFVDGNGNPCFWLGDTQWELFLAVKSEEAQAIMKDRQKKGFNAIQVMLLGVGGGKKANVAGERPFLNDDVSTPNEAYFRNVDTVVETAERLSLVLVIGIYHKAPDSRKMITERNARAYGAWIGRRYREAPNVIWSMYPEAKPEYVPVVRELAAGLAEGDGKRHLITVHPDPGPASSSWIHEEPWLSFNTLQTWTSDYLNHSMVAADYARTPVKPALNGEARYEAEDSTTPLMVRRGAYWSVLGGGFYSFGHGGNWMKPADWKKWLDSPASQQMTILRAFFETLDWWSLVPDRGIIGKEFDFQATKRIPILRAIFRALDWWSRVPVAARSSNRTWAVVYFPIRKSVDVKLDAVNAMRSATATWMNPATGRTQAAGQIPVKGTRSFKPPEGWEDAILVLRAAP